MQTRSLIASGQECRGCELLTMFGISPEEDEASVHWIKSSLCLKYKVFFQVFFGPTCFKQVENMEC